MQSFDENNMSDEEVEKIIIEADRLRDVFEHLLTYFIELNFYVRYNEL